MTLSYDLFPANHGSTFAINSHCFSCALHSKDSSWQESEKNFQEMNILIKTILVYCLFYYHALAFAIDYPWTDSSKYAMFLMTRM